MRMTSDAMLKWSTVYKDQHQKLLGALSEPVFYCHFPMAQSCSLHRTVHQIHTFHQWYLA